MGIAPRLSAKKFAHRAKAVGLPPAPVFEWSFNRSLHNILSIV